MREGEEGGVKEVQFKEGSGFGDVSIRWQELAVASVRPAVLSKATMTQLCSLFSEDLAMPKLFFSDLPFGTGGEFESIRIPKISLNPQISPIP